MEKELNKFDVLQFTPQITQKQFKVNKRKCEKYHLILDIFFFSCGFNQGCGSGYFSTASASTNRHTVSSKFFDTLIPSISTEKLVLLRHARCVLSRLRCNGHSLLLSSYLSRIGRIENPSCSGCGHPSQDTSHLILHCPATDPLRRSLFDNFLSLYDHCLRPWGVSQLLGLLGFPPSTHPLEGVG